MESKKKKIPNSKILKYLIVGGTAYLFEMGVIYLLHKILKYSPVTAVAISYWLGLVAAFILQKTITFQNRDMSRKGLRRQIWLYTLLVVFNYAFSLAIVKIFAEVASVYVLRTVAIIITTAWNYLVYHKIFLYDQKTSKEQY